MFRLFTIDIRVFPGKISSTSLRISSAQSTRVRRSMISTSQKPSSGANTMNRLAILSCSYSKSSQAGCPSPRVNDCTAAGWRHGERLGGVERGTLGRVQHLAAQAHRGSHASQDDEVLHAQPFGDEGLQPLTTFFGGVAGKRIVDLSYFRWPSSRVLAPRFAGVT